MKKEYDFSKGTRGAVLPAKNKTRVTMYLDTDVLDAFRDLASARGIGYQTLINQTLREHLAGDTSLDATVLRKILREELKRANL